MKPSSPIFVLGTPRAGTTLLRVMLDGHEQLFSPPEMVMAPFATMRERQAVLTQRFWEKGGLRNALMHAMGITVEEAKALEESWLDLDVPSVYTRIQEALGDRILVDKCPHLCADAAALARLTHWYPDAKFVWIVRHPGSVIRSIQHMSHHEVLLQGYDATPDTLWHMGNKNIEDFLATVPAQQWVRLQYEELVMEPEATMRRVLDTLGLEFDPAVLEPYTGDRMREGPPGARPVGDPNMASHGRIRPELATKWLAGFDASTVDDATRAMAAQFGYDLDALGPPPMKAVTAGMEDLWETMRRLEGRLRAPTDLDAAEGRRFLLRTLAASIDACVEQDDFIHPTLMQAEGPTRKMFADCPDADYRRASIQLKDGAMYRIYGTVPAGTTHVGIHLYRRGGMPGRSLDDAQWGVDPTPGGRFEVLLHGPGASLPGAAIEAATATFEGHGDETTLLIRQYFTDRAAQAPLVVDIERLDAGRPAALSPERMSAGLTRAKRMLESVVERTVGTYERSHQAALHRFIDVPADALFPTKGNEYRAAWFSLAEDHIMIIRGRLPKARYFGFCLYNQWLESFDYERHRIQINHEAMASKEDGTFEVVVAPKDPGHPNWLDTAGHASGYVVARALHADGMPQLDVQVVTRADWEQRRPAISA